MYTETLSGPQRRALMQLLAYLSGVDGDVSVEEVAYIAATSSQLGVEEPTGALFQAVADQDLETICACFDQPHTRAIALGELLSIAYADGRYDETERAAVRAVAAAMKATPDVVERLEAWVQQGLAWQAEGQRLMGLGEG